MGKRRGGNWPGFTSKILAAAGFPPLDEEGPLRPCGFPVSDPQSRIADYQSHADACMTKAGEATDETVRSQYMRLAETYLELVQMELRRIEIRGGSGLEGEA